MKNNINSIVVLCGWALFASAGFAQVPGAPRPAVSPYLQLNRPGESPAINYYGLIRPQQAANKSFLALGTDINLIDQQMLANQANQLSQTGHPSSFMTQGRYFMNNGATAAAGKQGMQPQGQQKQQPKTR